MPDLYDLSNYLAAENGLAVVSTTQKDGRVLSSVANCSVFRDPMTSTKVVGFVSVANAARLRHIRRGSQVTVVARRGWEWAAVTGPATLVGPDDLPEGCDEDGLRLLLRDVFVAAGGTHSNWDEYDQTMRDERRVVVLIYPDRIIGNG